MSDKLFVIKHDLTQGILETDANNATHELNKIDYSITKMIEQFGAMYESS